MSETWPYIDSDAVSSLVKIIESGNWNYWVGDEGRLFEREFADYLGVSFGIALSNGTVALELALRVLDIGPGDEVIVTCRSFMASASCIVQRGAIAVFCDVEYETGNINPDEVAQLITEKTKAIVCVHLGGAPCDMDSIKTLANKHGLFIIEDCAQAHGAEYRNKKVGSFGDVAAFSFCQDKIMTTLGEGGFLATNNERLFEKAWAFKDHGKNKEKMAIASEPYRFKWVHDSFGSNLRLPELQSALGRLQLANLDNWIHKRNENAQSFNTVVESTLGDQVVVVPDRLMDTKGIRHAKYKHYVYLGEEIVRDVPSLKMKVLEYCCRLGVRAFHGSCSNLSREACFATSSNHIVPRKLEMAERLDKVAIAFEVHPNKTKTSVERDALILCEAIFK